MLSRTRRAVATTGLVLGISAIVGQTAAHADPAAGIPVEQVAPQAVVAADSDESAGSGAGSSDAPGRVLSILGTGSSAAASGSASVAPLAKPLELGSSVLSTLVGFVPGPGTILSLLISGSATVTGSSENLGELAKFLGSGSASAGAGSASSK